jgi:hypothetical protein
MQIEDIKRRLQELEARHGRWTSDNIRLADELYTIGMPRRREPGMPYTGNEGVDPRVRSFIQVVVDVAGQPLDTLRVLDVQPAEGLMAAEFACHGAAVVALAPRPAQREKLLFLKEVFGHDKLQVLSDGARELDLERHGAFDVVLCAGLLDRLDLAGLYEVTKRIAAVCRRVCLIDTHVSLVDKEGFVHHGLIYWGRTIQDEHGSSFWLTRPSLFNLLRQAGFTSIYECHQPMGYVFADRHTFVALKGQRQKIHTVPLLNEPEEDRDEKLRLSAPPRENADVYLTHEDLLANYNYLRTEYWALSERHAELMRLGGLLRQLPSSLWQAIRRGFARMRGR